PDVGHGVEVAGLERFVERTVGGEDGRFVPGGSDERTVAGARPSAFTVTPRCHDREVPMDPPRTLSPSKVAAFTDCALAFRFSVIDHLPEPPSPWATKGTLVHAALERLFLLAPDARTIDAALAAVDDAFAVLRFDDEYLGLRLD